MTDVLKQVQSELKEWQEHNFPGRPAHQPLLGCGEELGELNHAFLKREQGIRKNEDHDENIKDAVADLMVYLCDFCNAEGISASDELARVWAKVRKRDWKANPADAAKIAEAAAV